MIISRISLIFKGRFGDGGGTDFRKSDGDLTPGGDFAAPLVSIGAGTLRSEDLEYG
jgi:hypothetical protein